VGGSVLLATVALNLPLLLGGALTIALGLGLFLVMPERNFRPSPREGRSSLQQVAATARGGVTLVGSRPVLLMLLLVAVFTGMSEEGFDRLYAKHFLDGLVCRRSAAWTRLSGSASSAPGSLS
jgi:DHA3 family tetracycline resistance protein-like MFS transporter